MNYSIGKYTISDWEIIASGSVMRKICLGDVDIGEFWIYHSINGDYWTISIVPFSFKDYYCCFCRKLKFSSIQEGKDCVDNFLVKLQKLIVFI